MSETVRLDKWLWAARFYKTRSIAKQAIEGGKVHYEGARVKPGRAVAAGATIVLRQGFDEKTVVVKSLSDRRKSAPEAQLLYEETRESIDKREEAALKRKADAMSRPHTEHRPDKKQRRDLKKFREQGRSED